MVNQDCPFGANYGALGAQPKYHCGNMQIAMIMQKIASKLYGRLLGDMPIYIIEKPFDLKPILF